MFSQWILGLQAVCRSESVLALVAALLISGTLPTLAASATQAAPDANPRLAASPEPFRIVAYATEGITESTIPYGQLTHINYSFLIPNADGTFKPISNPAKLKNIVAAAHRHPVRVNIAVGGWGWDSQFEEMAAQAATRTAFVTNLQRFIQDFNLDGADIDWEYPDPGQSSKNFLALVRELRTALAGKILTAAVVAYGDGNGLGIPVESFALLDFVNVMTYDGPDHGSLEQFNRGLSYWSGRGLPKPKTVLGVPFYSRAQGPAGETATFARLVAANPAAAQTNIFELAGLSHRYNSIPMIKLKTRAAMESAGGIMFWVLDADAPGEFSLVQAIHQTVHSQ